MDQPEPIQVSLSAVRRGLEQLKPYLTQQFATLPASVKSNFQEYVKSLQLFNDSPDAQRVLLAQVSEILGPAKQYTSGTLGQKIFGCLRYSDFPSSVVSCVPDCLDALHDNSTTRCNYPVFEESATGQLETKNMPDFMLGTTNKSGVVILKTRSTLNSADIAYLKSQGITAVQRMVISDVNGTPSIKTSPFESIDAPTVVLPTPAIKANTVTATVPQYKATSASGGGFFIFLIIVLLIVGGIWYWYKKKGNYSPVTVNV